MCLATVHIDRNDGGPCHVVSTARRPASIAPLHCKPLGSIRRDSTDDSAGTLSQVEQYKLELESELSEQQNLIWWNS
jgi:hypothetical protein